jgi:hypothetical protein
MTDTSLSVVQGPLKEQCRDDPESAVVTLIRTTPRLSVSTTSAD